MNIMVTCFEAFADETVNASDLAVGRLPGVIAGANIIKLKIPVSFNKCLAKVEEAIIKYNPDAILSVGEAGGRTCISVERVGVNIDEAPIPDNGGSQPYNQKIDPNGPDGRLATIPVHTIVKMLNSSGIPAEISNTAGTYVCNHVMYGVLNFIANNSLNIKAGFIHVPFVPEQTVGKRGIAFLPADFIAKGIEKAVEVIALDLQLTL